MSCEDGRQALTVNVAIPSTRLNRKTVVGVRCVSVAGRSNASVYRAKGCECVELGWAISLQLIALAHSVVLFQKRLSRLAGLYPAKA